jgi:hypothetical protein
MLPSACATGQRTCCWLHRGCARLGEEPPYVLHIMHMVVYDIVQLRVLCTW